MYPLGGFGLTPDEVHSAFGGMSLEEVIDDPAVWERCRRCGHEYRYPHLCRRHWLCGNCHDSGA